MQIVFIAVQCVQCSTMQKKSRNKWVCAVCNQRQSVLRIHARGHLARDIRNFVQEFNLSRMNRESGGRDSFSPKSDGYLIASEIGSTESLGVEPACLVKRRTDWSEYLDPEEDDSCAEDEEDPAQGMQIVFIAVQCVQCSTMQVRQQKKSRNKWACAVCNQRQLVLRIHARGHLARDIRNFVQEFNLSRMKRESGGRDSFSPKSDGYLIASEIGSTESLGVEPACLVKRRTDWSEYLDPEEDDSCAEDEEDPVQGTLFVRDVTTELPTKELNHLSKKRLTITKKNMPLKKISSSYNVDYKGILQKNKGECVTIRKRSSSRWSYYLDKQGDCDKSFEEDSFGDCSKVGEETSG